MNKKKLLEYSKLLMILVGVMAFRSSFADHYHIPSESMKPTLVPGSRVLVNKLAYDVKVPFTQISLAKTNEPQRGDVVVFANPQNPSQNYIKRIIGLPGDRIMIAAGRVFINGKIEIKNNYRTVSLDNSPLSKQIPGKEYLVPDGSYFVLGDKRPNSYDSRYWGFLNRKLVKGKAVVFL